MKNNLVAAKCTGDDKKLKRAAPLKKKLDERKGLELSAKGTRFKLSRNMAGFHLGARDRIDILQDDPLTKMVFPLEPPDLRFPAALLPFENVSYGYLKAKHLTLKNISMAVHLGDRIGLVGTNGTGKSTLVKLTVADASAGVLPSSGIIMRHPRLRIGYFSQHATDELAALPSGTTTLSYLMDVADSELSASKARALFGGMGMPVRLASEVSVESLSGGQRFDWHLPSSCGARHNCSYWMK